MMELECPGAEMCGSDVGSDPGMEWTDARESLTIESTSPVEPLSYSECDEVFTAEDCKSDVQCNGTDEAVEELEQDDNFVVDSLGKIATEVSRKPALGNRFLVALSLSLSLILKVARETCPKCCLSRKLQRGWLILGWRHSASSWLENVNFGNCDKPFTTTRMYFERVFMIAWFKCLFRVL